MAFSDFNPEDFPFTIRLIDVDTGLVVFTEKVTGPGALRIPGLAESGARAVSAEIVFPSGRVIRVDPP